jgi:hypothetical protein
MFAGSIGSWRRRLGVPAVFVVVLDSRSLILY